MTPLLDIRNLSVEFRAPSAATKSLLAVRDLTISIAQSEVLGLVGESGSGKSLTSLAIMRLLPRQAKVSGEVWFGENSPLQNLTTLSDNSIRQLRGSKIAMIFQEPMTALNPVMRVGDQIAEAVLVHAAKSKKRRSKIEAHQLAVEAMNEVAIPQPGRRARDYPHQLSGGMRQRIMIAMAIVNRPQLLIADEPTTALDVTIQAQILDLLAELREKFSLAMLFISHDLAVVSKVAHRVAVMYAGSIVEQGSVQDIFRNPAHPYTQGLLRAVPGLKTARDRPLGTINGSVPPLHAMPPGCAFEPRCEFRISECGRTFPTLEEVGPGHWARCPVVNAQKHL